MAKRGYKRCFSYLHLARAYLADHNGRIIEILLVYNASSSSNPQVQLQDAGDLN